ncbi:MAG: WD40/YVTN/BNR-like repeat-containing protein [Candidatus Methylomirabilales bacterium]
MNPYSVGLLISLLLLAGPSHVWLSLLRSASTSSGGREHTALLPLVAAADHRGEGSRSPAESMRCGSTMLLFRDAQRGWVVGDGGRILATIDGGHTWHRHTASHLELSGIAFVSNQQGWVVGDAGTILSTHDGGASWTRHPPVTSAFLYRVCFLTPTVGWIVGAGGTILVTRDGGRQWQAQKSAVGQALRDIACFSPHECVVVGDEGTVLTTQDGGATWTSQRRISIDGLVDVGDDNFTGVVITPDGTVWATAGGRQGYVLRSDDRGKTWAMPIGGNLRMQAPSSLHFWDYRKGIVVGTELMGGGHGILLTTDGGASWTVAKIAGWRGFIYVYSVFFVNERVGWARAQNVTILHTEDGGQTWSIQHSER